MQRKLIWMILVINGISSLNPNLKNKKNSQSYEAKERVSQLAFHPTRLG